MDAELSDKVNREFEASIFYLLLIYFYFSCSNISTLRSLSLFLFTSKNMPPITSPTKIDDPTIIPAMAPLLSYYEPDGQD